MVALYSIYAGGSAFWLGVKAFATLLVPGTLIAHLGGAGHRASSVEIYFARFFGLTLVPIIAQVVLSIQAGNEDARRTLALTTLFLHLTSALHVFNRFRLTRDPGLTRDAGGSLLLAIFGAYLCFGGLV